MSATSELGIEMSHPEPQRPTREMMNEADRVITMGYAVSESGPVLVVSFSAGKRHDVRTRPWPE